MDVQFLAIERYAYSQLRSAYDYVLKPAEFIPVKDEQGQLKFLRQFPHVGIAQKLLTNLLRHQQRFGLAIGTKETSEDINDFGAEAGDAHC